MQENAAVSVIITAHSWIFYNNQNEPNKPNLTFKHCLKARLGLFGSFWLLER